MIQMKMMTHMVERWHSGEMSNICFVSWKTGIWRNTACEWQNMVKMCEYTDFKFFDIEDHKLYELESDTDSDIYF